MAVKNKQTDIWYSYTEQNIGDVCTTVIKVHP